MPICPEYHLLFYVASFERHINESRMNNFKRVANKIMSTLQAEKKAAEWRAKNKKIVFTNGCFDILHYGHVHYLADAKNAGDYLVVGINSAASVKRLKGAHRPINDDLTRFHLLAALAFVDIVVEFDEDTPLELIKKINPNVLVKGGDWQPAQIVGSDFVLAGGGEVKSLPFVAGYSTTNIEAKIRSWKSEL